MKGRVGLLVAALVAVLAACSTAPRTPPSSPSSTPVTPATSAATPTAGPSPTPAPQPPREPIPSFVTAQGRDFLVDGAPFRFVGVNIYDAAATERYSCDPALRMSPDELEATMRTLHDSYGVSVVRFWAYQTYTASGQDWSGVDRVIDIARRVGIRLLPVLEDGPGYCTTMAEAVPKSLYQDDTWFTDGYRAQYGTAPMSYRDYAKVVAEHYRDEPTILGWSLMNEADTSARDGTGRSVLVDFARDMGRVVASVDANHLITLGTQSNGARGASGLDFADVYALPELDFTEVHDWEPWGDRADPLPGGIGGRPPAPDDPACETVEAPVACSFALSARLDKPLIVGEAGIGATDPGARAVRAEQLAAKMRAALDAGAAGYLLWRVTRTHEDIHDITLNSHDPVLTVLGDIASGLADD